MRSRLLAAAVCALMLTSCGNKKTGEPNPEYAGGYLGAEIVSADAEYADSSSGQITLNEWEEDLLSHLISCEAGEFPYTTQVCFAEMLLNRILDDSFPNDALGVVFESGDFKSVLAGKVTGTLPQGCRVTRRFRSAEKALHEALGDSDITDGALYYAVLDEEKAQMSVCCEYGGMAFGK